MQNRMKQHQLTDHQINALLERTDTGCLATTAADGRPYVVPVHFFWDGAGILIHGLPAGEKLSNIKRNPNVCFTAYEMMGLLLDEEEKPCDTNTQYESVVIKGTAELVSDYDAKADALAKTVGKYTPQLSGRELPQNMVRGTAVIRITPAEITGKYYG